MTIIILNNPGTRKERKSERRSQEPNANTKRKENAPGNRGKDTHKRTDKQGTNNNTNAANPKQTAAREQTSTQPTRRGKKDNRTDS